MDRFRIDILPDGLRDVGLRGKCQERRPIGVLQAVVVRDGARGLHEARIHTRLGTARDRFRHLRDMLERKRLRCLPAIEEVAVRADEGQHLAIAGRGVELDGRRKVAKDGQNRPVADIFEGEDFFFLPKHHDAIRHRLSTLFQWQVFAIAAEQPKPHGDGNGFSFRALSARRIGLAERDAGGFGALRIGHARVERGRPRLIVPEHEFRQIGLVCIAERRDKILHRHGLPIVALEVEIEASPETILAKHRLQHPAEFGALVVDRARVEVVDFNKGRGACGVCERACIFRELGALEEPNFLDALHDRRAHVRAELLVAEYRQALLEAQLEPIAAGDAVARPIMKIFVRDHGLDAFVIGIGCGFGPGEDQGVVEDIQALVLHRAHVEVRDGHDHEGVEIVFEAEALFVPFHRALERLHRPGAAVILPGFDIDPQIDLAARTGRKAVLHHAELSGDQCEEIGGLRKGVFPNREVAARAGLAALDEVAIRKQDRRVFPVCFNAHSELRQDIRPVEVIGDAAETFGLALGAIDALRPIEAGERLVRFRIANRLDFERKRRGRHSLDCQILICETIA